MDFSTTQDVPQQQRLGYLRQAMVVIARMEAGHLLTRSHVGEHLRKVKQAPQAHRHRTGLHAHAWCELCLPLAGDPLMETATGIYALGDSSLAVITPGMEHCERRRSETSHHAVLWVCFSGAAILTMVSVHEPGNRWLLPWRSFVSGKLATPFQSATPTMEDWLTDHLEPFRLAMMNVLAHCYRQALQPPHAISRAQLGQQHLQLLKALTVFMEQHLDQAITLQDLASIAHMSPNHLNTLFRQWTGAPLHTWIVKKRMDKAMMLLQQPGMLAKQVAAKVGYSDPLYFSRAFHRHFGYWPSQARHEAMRK